VGLKNVDLKNVVSYLSQTITVSKIEATNLETLASHILREKVRPLLNYNSISYDFSHYSLFRHSIALSQLQMDFLNFHVNVIWTSCSFSQVNVNDDTCFIEIKKTLTRWKEKITRSDPGLVDKHYSDSLINF